MRHKVTVEKILEKNSSTGYPSTNFTGVTGATALTGGKCPLATH